MEIPELQKLLFSDQTDEARIQSRGESSIVAQS